MCASCEELKRGINLISAYSDYPEIIICFEKILENNENECLLRIYVILQTLYCTTEVERIAAEKSNNKEKISDTKISKFIDKLKNEDDKNTLLQLIEIRDCVSHFGPRFSPSGILKTSANNSACDCARPNKHNKDGVVCGNIFIQENLQNKGAIINYFKPIYSIIDNLRKRSND